VPPKMSLKMPPKIVPCSRKNCSRDHRFSDVLSRNFARPLSPNCGRVPSGSLFNWHGSRRSPRCLISGLAYTKLLRGGTDVATHCNCQVNSYKHIALSWRTCLCAARERASLDRACCQDCLASLGQGIPTFCCDTNRLHPRQRPRHKRGTAHACKYKVLRTKNMCSRGQDRNHTRA
jgi:hypothetical protein